MKAIINKIIRQNALFVIYQLEFSDGSAYIGRTQNPKRRFRDHRTMIANRNCDLHQIQAHTELHQLVNIRTLERHKSKTIASAREKVLIGVMPKSLNLQNRPVKQVQLDRGFDDYLRVLNGDYSGFTSERIALNFKNQYQKRIINV